MARETKAQREARESTERFLAWEEFRAEYPRRFARVLYEFTLLDASGAHTNDEPFEVSLLDDETFRFRHGWNDYELKVTAPANPVWEVLYHLESLEGSVQNFYKERAEQARREQVRTAALNKLNTEERELLGL